NCPRGENFCTRPVMSTTYRLSSRSTATERGLFNSPIPAPRCPIISTRSKNWLRNGFSSVVGKHPLRKVASKKKAAEDCRTPRPSEVAAPSQSRSVLECGSPLPLSSANGGFTFALRQLLSAAPKRQQVP